MDIQAQVMPSTPQREPWNKGKLTLPRLGNRQTRQRKARYQTPTRGENMVVGVAGAVGHPWNQMSI